MRPHGSDLLEADRLKAGGFKPGTWALKPGVTAAQVQASLDVVFRQTARAGLDSYHNRIWTYS